MNCRLIVCLLTSLLPCLPASAPEAGAQDLRTRWMDELNWMEFRELVPARTKTVLLTTGTLEPHGVINNGADNLAPVKIAEAIAPEVNALIAPHIPYGITGSLAPYPGALHIPAEAYRPYVRAVLDGLVKNGFRNLIVINGHGGPQTAVLEELAQQVALTGGVNTLVINWWAVASDITLEVFGEDGGHAGINETAFIQAINPRLVLRERYTRELAQPNPPPGSWSATPFPSSIGLYKEGQGYPIPPGGIDPKKAEEYYRKVIARVAALVKDTLARWQRAGFN